MRKKIIYNNKQLSYSTQGSGPVVVLLHGFGEDGSIWHNQIETLKNFQLIIPELPGTGQSEIIEDMSMDGLADAVQFILKAEQSNDSPPNGNKVTMIGHSMGGYITLAFADKYSEILNGMGLFHSTAYADTEEKVQARRKGIEFIRSHGANEFLKTTIPNLYAPFIKENNPSLIQKHLDSVHNFSADSLVNYYESMIKRPARVEVLKNITVPVLFIFGKYDSAVPLKDGLEQCYLPSLSYIHVLDQSGHMGMIEEHEKTNIILSNYLLSIDHQTP